MDEYIQAIGVEATSGDAPALAKRELDGGFFRQRVRTTGLTLNLEGANMPDLIKSSRPLEASGHESAATLISDPVIPGLPEGAGTAADSARLVAQDDSALFREEMRQRCEAPFALPQCHDGLNE